MRASLICLALVTAGCSATAQTPVSPDWLAGYWLSCEGGVRTAESWFGAGSGTLLGTNLTQGRQTSYEFLRVASNAQGGLSYYSMPNGAAPATEFVMISHADSRVVFANPQHDFPQRIIYERVGERLHARIEGEVDGRTEGMDWNFRRAPADSDCSN